MAHRGRALRAEAILAQALTEAVEAATAGDLAAYDVATARLAAQDPARTSGVTGTAVRGLLEERHPDGLTGDDVGDLLRACAATGAFLPDLDPDVLLLVVTGSLGLLEAEDQPTALTGTAVLRHAPVVLAALLGRDALAPRLAAALAELRRAETVELP